MGNEDNFLIQLGEVFFEKMGMSVPYFLTQDLRSSLNEKSIEYTETKKINSTCNFKNSPTNRSKMANFLLGNYSAGIDDATIEEIISKYEKDGTISLPLSDSIFTIRK